MNKEKNVKSLLIFTAIVLLLGIVFGGGVIFGLKYTDELTRLDKSLRQKNPLTPEPSAKSPPALTEQAEAILNKMSDEEKIGQLFLVGVNSAQIDDKAKELIRKYHVGGVVLFDRNMVSPAQTTVLVNQLQQEALAQNIALPLFVCIDQEGGLVLRMRDKVSPIPAQESVAQTGEPAKARLWAAQNAAELKSMGFNVNFAPVVDLGATYQRSYGTDPATVEAFAREALGGYQKGEILAGLKHFPGIGKATIDPHKDTSIIAASRQTLEENDIAPFRNIIRDLDNQTFLVMVSHLKYPAYDSELPASLSTTIMRDLLREELGFTGLIVTDDMEMGALTNLYPFEEMGYLSVNAGADLILVCHDFRNQIAVWNGLMQALQSGQLSQDTLNDRVRRIILAKLARVKGGERDPRKAEEMVGRI